MTATSGDFCFFVGLLGVYNHNIGNDKKTLLQFTTSNFDSLLVTATCYFSYSMLRRPAKEEDFIWPGLNKHRFFYAW